MCLSPDKAQEYTHFIDGNKEAWTDLELALSLCVSEVDSNILWSEHEENFLASVLVLVLHKISTCSFLELLWEVEDGLGGCWLSSVLSEQAELPGWGAC